MEMVKVEAQDYGLEQDKAKEIEMGFTPAITALNELKPEFDLIIQQEISPELCLQAGELRKKFVKIRTNTASIHKSLKAFYLAGGRFVDAWKNKQLTISEQVEGKLKEIEEHYIRIEQAKKEERAKERLVKLQAIENTGEGIDVLNLPDELFATVLKGLETEYKERKQAEAQAEADRIKAEQERIKEDQRIREENQKLKTEAEAKEKALAEERAKAEALAKAGDKEKIIAYFSVLGEPIEIKDRQLNEKYITIIALIKELQK